MRTPATTRKPERLLLLGRIARANVRALHKTATGVPAAAGMSVESYAVRAAAISAADCSFVDLTLWITVLWAEGAHGAGFDGPKRLIG
jgi:hypothetical protein